MKAVVTDGCFYYIEVVQGDSVARGPKLLSIKNYVIEIMTSKFIYTYRERCKIGPAETGLLSHPSTL